MATIVKVSKCPKCKGKKTVKIDENTYKCFTCSGTGKVLIRKTNIITVEPF